MADVEADVVSYINTNTSWTEGTDLFRGPVLPVAPIGGAFPVPDKAVFVRVASSIPPVIHRVDDLQEKEWLVDVIHRTEPDKYGTGWTAAQALLDAVNDASVASGAFADYVDVRTQQSAPTWIDQDDMRCHYLVFTVRLRKLEA